MLYRVRPMMATPMTDITAPSIPENPVFCLYATHAIGITNTGIKDIKVCATPAGRLASATSESVTPRNGAEIDP